METEQCFCKSFYDESNTLQNCTCGKCYEDKSVRVFSAEQERIIESLKSQEVENA